MRTRIKLTCTSLAVRSLLSDSPDNPHDPRLADPPPGETNYFSDSGTIESSEFPTPPEELSEEGETLAEEDEDQRKEKKSQRLHIDKGSLGDGLVSGGNPRSDTKLLASLSLDSIQTKALLPSSSRNPPDPKIKIRRRSAKERRSGSEGMSDLFHSESTDEDNPSQSVLKPPPSSSSRRPDSARVELSQQKYRNSSDSNHRIMAPRSTTKKTTSAAEPELIMPSIHEDGLGGSWAVEDTPRRRGSKAITRKSNSVIPVKSENVDTPEKPRPPKTVPSTSKKRFKSSTPMSDHATTFLLKPAGSWIYDVLGNTLHKIKTPLSYLLAIWLFLGLVAILRNLFTNSIYSALSPICRIPGSSLLSLPMCRHHSAVSPSVPTPTDLPPVQFDRLMTVQSQFESILQEAAGGVSLPFEMKSSEASIRNLRQVVRYSSLRSKNELVLEFDGFVETAQIASFDLQKFNSHVGRGVDNILATARWTKRLLDGIAITDSSRGSISSFLNDKILAPFQPVRFTEGIVLDHYIRHTRLVEEEIKRLILEAQALLLTLVNLEDRLDAIHGIVVRDDIHAQLSKTEILSHLWTKLGGNRSKLGKFNSQLHLLGQVNTYRESAIAHVSGTLIKLQAMGAELGELQERVGGVEFLDVGKGGVPLSVHIENIELGVERLEQGRTRAAGVQSEELRRVMNRGRKGEIEAG